MTPLSQAARSLVPVLHGECFNRAARSDGTAYGYMLCRDGTFRSRACAFLTALLRI